MDAQQMTNLFCELVKIPSPSGEEKEVALKVKSILDQMDVSNHFDSSSEQTRANCNNLIAEIGEGSPTLLFSAHLDTVEERGKPIHPVVKDGVIYSDGTTVLGADDKAGVVSLLQSIEELHNRADIPKCIFVFSTNEEDGDVGMSVEFAKLNQNIDYAFALDGSESTGTFMHKILGTKVFDILIEGRPAHAEREPQKGANALRAAGIIMSKLKLGKAKDGSMLNLGFALADGSSSAVVPYRAKLGGEYGAFSLERLDKIKAHIEKVTKEACEKTGCTYEIKWYKTYYAPPLNNKSNTKIVKLARKAAKDAGVKFNLIKYHATTEANMWSGIHGYDTLGMCKGGGKPHQTEEFVSVKDLVDVANIVNAIVLNAKKLG